MPGGRYLSVTASTSIDRWQRRSSYGVLPLCSGTRRRAPHRCKRREGRRPDTLRGGAHHRLQRGVGSDLHNHLAEVAAAQHLAEACRDVLKPVADVFAILDLPRRHLRCHFGEEGVMVVPT